MRRTFVSFNKEGRAENRLDGFYPEIEVSKAEFIARRQEVTKEGSEMFLVDEDLLLNHLLASTSVTYDVKTDTLKGDSLRTSEVSGGIQLSLNLLRDDFGGRQKNEPCYGNWDSKMIALRGD
ncbi:hypothetical protein LSM04_005764 [Trypanosoma melophagium]|uniref:uncharacterized protein n=1 Tax=Trypanosoma melophagium TaxID=715481 RepID=UPI00351A2EBC|nr:hypothetical protein LSM04_000661 [Trypanosoma melophagium]KAH9598395.1 hypothetical protein LSM04_005764 [Trypanosoma melophagium]